MLSTDKEGNTVDFLLTRRRSKLVAHKFLLKAISNNYCPKVINIDKSGANREAIKKEKTGYDIDIFGDLRKHVVAIIEQNEIRSQKELNDIGTMLHFYHQVKGEGEEVEKLKTQLTDYANQTSVMPLKRKGEY